MTFPLYSIFELKNEQISFLKDYDVANVYISNKRLKKKLQKKENRVCRFCGKSFPTVKFDKKAHLIPNFLGNNTLLSDFECDTCNNKFSLFETDFTSYLGIYRVFNPINNKKTKLKSDTIVAMEIALTSGKLITYIINQNLEIGSFDVDLKNGKTEINYTKPTYTPINIYKLLLKIALCCLDESEILQYKKLIDFFNTDNDKALIPFCQNVGYYKLSVKVESPRVIIFKRKELATRNFMHQVHFYFQEFVYLFLIPYNIIDIKTGKYQDANVNIELCPPLFFEDPLEPIYYSRDFIDFSSIEKQKQKENIGFETNPENMKSSEAWDQTNGINNNHKFGEVPIEGVIMFQSGQIMTDEDLIEMKNIFKNFRRKK